MIDQLYERVVVRVKHDGISTRVRLDLLPLPDQPLHSDVPPHYSTLVRVRDSTLRTPPRKQAGRCWRNLSSLVHMPGAVTCTSSQPHDAHVAECAAWCEAREAHAHCSWCKCRACPFCTDESTITHVYASAGSSMVACEEDPRVGALLSASTVNEYAALEHCKQACDAAMPGCRSFSYSAIERRCELHSAAGEPARFCAKSGWSSFWRVEIPQATAAAAPAVGSPTATAVPAAISRRDPAGSAAGGAGGNPRRVVVKGSRLFDSQSGG